MESAVARIQHAVAAGETIAVYGDYDVDGVTGTALLLEVLARLGASPRWYIPDRFEEGYGLHAEALRGLRGEGVDLVLTVDCGIRAVDEIRAAAEMGLDVVVTDHHEPGPAAPPATAVIDPRVAGDPYPFKGLAGVGLAYKLGQALLEAAGKPDPDHGLDLVALGTVADLAPLWGENRSLVLRGLEQLNSGSRIGLRILTGNAGRELGSLGASGIAFGLGPRLNAAGRMRHAATALRLLLAGNPSEAQALATSLEGLNRERQRRTRETVRQVRGHLVEFDAGLSPVLAVDAGFHPGVVGLAAARLAEEFYRPALVGVVGEEHIRGSARSIPGFHITRALEQCSGLLVRFGGHAAAAGFTLTRGKLDAFERRLGAVVTERLQAMDLRPTVELDVEIEFSALDEALLEFVESLEPCGIGNPLPLFGSRQVRVAASRAVGTGGAHLKLTLESQGRFFDAIAFRKGGMLTHLPERVDIAFYFERNRYRGYESMQLRIQEIRAATNP
jgi:single-stranded-DNA-specific exonuclease